jgi:LmbE family N-acetylglucosaminyl deacetylase
VLDIHDGELEPTLENRQKITRLIREWNADIVIAHRPWDYHPDHRYVGVLVQDAAFMVTVPFFCPDTPPLTKNPVFLYSSDRFQKPYPFKADIAVALDDVFEQKLKAVHELESQVYEGGANGSEAFVRSVPPASARSEAKGLAPRALGAPSRRRGQPLPQRPHEVVRPRARQRDQVRRGVRDLRVRSPRLRVHRACAKLACPIRRN